MEPCVINTVVLPYPLMAVMASPYEKDVSGQILNSIKPFSKANLTYSKSFSESVKKMIITVDNNFQTGIKLTEAEFNILKNYRNDPSNGPALYSFNEMLMCTFPIAARNHVLLRPKIVEELQRLSNQLNDISVREARYFEQLSFAFFDSSVPSTPEGYQLFADNLYKDLTRSESLFRSRVRKQPFDDVKLILLTAISKHPLDPNLGFPEILMPPAGMHISSSAPDLTVPIADPSIEVPPSPQSEPVKGGNPKLSTEPQTSKPTGPEAPPVTSSGSGTSIQTGGDEQIQQEPLIDQPPPYTPPTGEETIDKTPPPRGGSSTRQSRRSAGKRPIIQSETEFSAEGEVVTGGRNAGSRGGSGNHFRGRGGRGHQPGRAHIPIYGTPEEGGEGDRSTNQGPKSGEQVRQTGDPIIIEEVTNEGEDKSGDKAGKGSDKAKGKENNGGGDGDDGGDDDDDGDDDDSDGDTSSGDEPEEDVPGTPLEWAIFNTKELIRENKCKMTIYIRYKVMCIVDEWERLEGIDGNDPKALQDYLDDIAQYGMVYSDGEMSYDGSKCTAEFDTMITRPVRESGKLTYDAWFIIYEVIGARGVDKKSMIDTLMDKFGHLDPGEYVDMAVYELVVMDELKLRSDLRAKKAAMEKEKVKVSEILAIPTKDEVFDEKTRRKVRVEREFLTLMRQADVGRYEMVSDKLKIFDYEYTVRGVAQCIKENSWEVALRKDQLYAGIIVGLVKATVFTPVDQSNAEPTDAEIALISRGILPESFSMAKLMVQCSLYSFVSGLGDNSLRWYESFVKVKGASIGETRMVNLMKAIHAGNNMQRVMDTTTIGSVLSQNNVFNYRLMRISSPSLIKTALNFMPYSAVLAYFPIDSLKEYFRFESGGILAQIAAGPLREYCKGEANPLTMAEIPRNLMLSDLKAIKEPVYSAVVIRRAKTILDKMGYDYGNWYQAKRASVGGGPEDVMFGAIVDKIKERLKEMSNLSRDQEDEVVKDIGFKLRAQAEGVKEFMDMWLGK